MDVVKLAIPAAALLVIAGAFFGVVIARITWADEATRADKIKSAYVEMQKDYKEIHEKDQKTIAIMRETARMRETHDVLPLH